MAFQLQFAFLVSAVCGSLCVSAYIVPQVNSSLSTVKDSSSLCCQFESNTCGFDTYTGVVGFWDWSLYYKPNPSISTSNYLWTQNDNGASTHSPLVTVNAATTVIQFSYYAEFTESSANSEIAVSFLPTTGSLVLLDKLVAPGGIWLHHTTDCVGRLCCPTGYPCTGSIYFEAVIVSGSTALYAIDDVEIGNSCSYPGTGCCEFDANTCGFNIANPAIVGYWEWSGNGYRPNPTYFPLFPASGNYIFTENDNDATTYTTVSSFSASTTFDVKYYGQTDDLSSVLAVFFTPATAGSTDVLIDILGDTSNEWATRSFSCATSSCCSSYPCSGQIKFEARVQSPYALFAIDQVDINGSCL